MAACAEGYCRSGQPQECLRVLDAHPAVEVRRPREIYTKVDRRSGRIKAKPLGQKPR